LINLFELYDDTLTCQRKTAATVANKGNSQRIFEADKLESASMQLVLMLGYTIPNQHDSLVCTIAVDPCLMMPVFHHLYSNWKICSKEKWLIRRFEYALIDPQIKFDARRLVK